MTDHTKIKRRYIQFIRSAIIDQEEVDLTKLYLLCIEQFGISKRAVDDYLELLWDDKQIVWDKVTKTIRWNKSRKKLDELISLNVDSFGKAVEEDDDI